MNQPLHYTFKPFGALSNHELYGILQLRQEIFIVEQDCPYLDADSKDLQAIHILGHDQDQVLVTYARILPPGISYAGFSSIGRVVCRRDYRKYGHGVSLMQTALTHTKHVYPDYPVKIGAQAYLKRFYESLGFVDVGEPYLEDGIPHIIMIMTMP